MVEYKQQTKNHTSWENIEDVLPNSNINHEHKLKSSPKNHSNPGCENPQTIIKKNHLCQKTLFQKSKALPEGPAVVAKPKIRAKAALVAPEATNRAALALTGASCRFPLEGTTPVEMWEQLTKKTESWWQIFLGLLVKGDSR